MQVAVLTKASWLLSTGQAKASGCWVLDKLLQGVLPSTAQQGHAQRVNRATRSASTGPRAALQQGHA
jgi:hypothetical protein